MEQFSEGVLKNRKMRDKTSAVTTKAQKRQELFFHLREIGTLVLILPGPKMSQCSNSTAFFEDMLCDPQQPGVGGSGQNQHGTAPQLGLLSAD